MIKILNRLTACTLESILPKYEKCLRVCVLFFQLQVIAGGNAETPEKEVGFNFKFS